MANYHFQLKTDKKRDGTRTKASEHLDYINREGKYKDMTTEELHKAKQQLEKKTEQLQDKTNPDSHADYINREAAFATRGDCVYKQHHLPTWANNNPKTFFQKADLYESANSTRYREVEFHLPNELTLEQNKEIINEFVNNHLGEDFYWALAVHDKEAKFGFNGERNTHVHIMFSERKLDEIERTKERSPEVFFKKANRSHAEKGGCKKDSKWNSEERFAYLIKMRKDCALIQNRVLEKYGYDVTVDHRTLVAQRQAALERGDELIAKLLDRPAEKNIGYTAAMTENHPAVIDLKLSRQIRRDHQQLIIAAHILEKSLIKNTTIQSVNQSKEQADIALSEINNTLNADVSAKLQTLSDSIIATSKKLFVTKDLVIWDDQALAMARREYMTLEERELETKCKVNTEDIFLLRKAQKELYKHARSTDPKEYQELKKEIERRLNANNQRNKEHAAKLREVNKRLSTTDYKTKIYKLQQQILKENQPAKDMLKKEQAELDTLIAQTKGIIARHRDQKLEAVNQALQAVTDQNLETLFQAQNQKLTAIKIERAELESYKKAFESKPQPPSYSDERVAWNKERIHIQTQLDSLGQREKEIFIELHKIKDTIKTKEATKPNTLNPITNESTIEFTAREAKEILSVEIKALEKEYNLVKREADDILRNLISVERAQNIAEKVYLGDGYKTAREEESQIKKEEARIEAAKKEYANQKAVFEKMPKPSWFDSATKYNAQKAEVDSLCKTNQERIVKLEERKTANETTLHAYIAKLQTPEAKQKIEAIKNGILAKDKPKRELYNKLQTEIKNLREKISTLKNQERGLDKLVKQDYNKKIKTKHEHTYIVKQTTELAATKQSIATAAAANLANKIINPKAVSLSAKVFRDDDKEEFKKLIEQGIDLDFN